LGSLVRDCKNTWQLCHIVNIFVPKPYLPFLTFRLYVGCSAEEFCKKQESLKQQKPKLIIESTGPARRSARIANLTVPKMADYADSFEVTDHHEAQGYDDGEYEPDVEDIDEEDPEAMVEEIQVPRQQTKKPKVKTRLAASIVSGHLQIYN
jgi:hypothetical protein